MPRSRARDHDEKRQAILHRAAMLFSRDGYDRASMAGLAAEMGVSKALLYHYHASKEALLADIIENHLENLVETVEAVDEVDASAEERLRLLVSALLDAYRDADAEHRVQIEALRFLPDADQERLKRLERRLVDIFSDAVRGLDPAAFEGRAPLKPVTMALFGMLNWHYMWHREGGPVSRAQFARLASDILIGGVRNLG
jgi:TetR/AcrR family transcriptional regulator